MGAGTGRALGLTQRSHTQLVGSQFQQAQLTATGPEDFTEHCGRNVWGEWLFIQHQIRSVCGYVSMPSAQSKFYPTWATRPFNGAVHSQDVSFLLKPTYPSHSPEVTLMPRHPNKLIKLAISRLIAQEKQANLPGESVGEQNQGLSSQCCSSSINSQNGDHMELQVLTRQAGAGAFQEVDDTGGASIWTTMITEGLQWWS